jgi:hypothetical protein
MKKHGTLFVIALSVLFLNACINKKQDAPTVANDAAIVEQILGIPVFINSSPVKKFIPVGDALFMNDLAELKDTLGLGFDANPVLQSNAGEPTAPPDETGKVREMVQVIKTIHPDADAVIFSNKMTRCIAIRYSK